MNEIPLSCLRKGDACVVRRLDFPGGLGRRLRDLGLIPGTRIRCAFVAPSGSPMAFRIRGAVIALRRDDCDRIAVERCA